jgi:ATP-dependent exoDNAse (exonuclease V) beta subunit
MTGTPGQTKRLADQAERDRAAKDLDTTYLVEAAAGTGKTTILVDRILSILRADRASLRQIAAITFTEKAAGELKGRLRQAVERELREGSQPRSRALANALADIEGMSIGTIHAFCAELIRQRPVEARVEPGFAVADELTASLIREEAWEAWLAEQMSADSPAIRRAVESGIPFEAAGPRGSPLFNLACALIEQRDLISDGVVELPWTDAQFAEAFEALREQIAALAEARRKDCLAPEGDPCAMQIAALEEWAAGSSSPSFDAVRSRLEGAPSIKARAGKRGNWSSAAALDSARAQCARAKESLAQLEGEADHRVLYDLVEWLRPFLDCYCQAKERRRALDFTDLLLRARDMLRESRPARDYFKSDFQFILVDEFQDTDPLQAEILFFLSERPGAHATDWQAAELVPGKLFIVGDPKQSIYRFRRADLDLYGKAREAVERQGALLRLSVNFRTVPRITGEVNQLFQGLMTGPVEGRFEPQHVALVPYRPDEQAQPCILLAHPPKRLASETLSADDWRQKESGCIAELIRELRDGKVGGRPPVRHNEIAILYRTTTGLDSLEDALRARGVPYQVSGGRNYYKRTEFQNLLSVLKAIENPFDELSVVGALRSPFFGHSDEDLLRHFAAYPRRHRAGRSARTLAASGNFNYLAGAPKSCPILAEAFDALKELHERRRRDPPSAVLARLFETTRALQIYAMKPHGEQRVANLLKLPEIARAMAAAEVPSFGAFVRRLSEMENTRQAEPESPLGEPDEDFVQVMTMHKAKGLEFRVVILAHLLNRGESREQVLLDRAPARSRSERPEQSGEALGRLHLSLGSMKTRGWEAAKREEEDRAEHEQRRMLYVAMTRAKDLLVIPAFWSRDRQAGFLKYFCERYAPPAESREGSPTPAQRTAAVELVATDSFDLDQRSRDTLRLKPASTATAPPEARAAIERHEKWKAAVKAQAELLSAGRKIQTATDLMRSAEHEWSAAREPGRAADFGTLVHRLMESADFRSPGDLGPLADAEARQLGLSAADAREALALARNALAHPLISARAAKAQALYREVPFAFAEGEALFEGYMDLVFLENGNAVIVDYKTDSVNAAEAPEHAKRYAPQAQMYRRALSAALGRPVEEFHFLFLRPGVAVRQPS